MVRPTWFVTPQYVLHVASNVRYNKPTTGNWNGLAFAMNHAAPGDTIGFTGQHDGVQIGFGSPHSVDTVNWNNFPVHDLEIYGMNSTAKIRNTVAFGDAYGAPFNLTFRDYEQLCQSQVGYIANMHSGPFVGMTIRNVKFNTSFLTTAGKPICKWVFRFHGPTQFTIENCEQTHQIGEHFLYTDNVQGDSVARGCKATKNGRTMVQITNRIDSGPSGFGKVLIEDCMAIEPGITEGASAFTCAGHLGEVEFRNCQTINAHGGSVVAWAEPANPNTVPPKLGAYLNSDGKSINKFVVTGGDFQATSSDRDAVMISACSAAEMSQCQIASNKTGLHLDHQAGKANLAFKFTDPTPSQWGWNVPKKVTKGTNNTKLTDQQIDALYQP